MRLTEVFLDTAYAIALTVPADEHHEKALLLADRIMAEGARLITTRAVMIEIGNALSKKDRQAAVQLLSSFEVDSEINIVPDSEDLYARAFALYEARPDKGWGMTDCISFVVMQEAGLTSALTTDQHFEQAGFIKLL